MTTEPAANNKSVRSAAIGRQIERLWKRGERLTARASNPCTGLIAKTSAILDRVDDLLWKQEQLGHPNPSGVETNDGIRETLAELIGMCLDKGYVVR